MQHNHHLLAAHGLRRTAVAALLAALAVLAAVAAVAATTTAVTVVLTAAAMAVGRRLRAFASVDTAVRTSTATR